MEWWTACYRGSASGYRAVPNNSGAVCCKYCLYSHSHAPSRFSRWATHSLSGPYDQADTLLVWSIQSSHCCARENTSNINNTQRSAVELSCHHAWNIKMHAKFSPKRLIVLVPVGNVGRIDHFYIVGRLISLKGFHSWFTHIYCIVLSTTADCKADGQVARGGGPSAIP